MKLYVENAGRDYVNNLSRRLKTAFLNDIGETIYFDISACSNLKVSNEEWFISLNNCYGITHKDLDLTNISDVLRNKTVLYTLENYITLLKMMYIKDPKPIFVEKEIYRPFMQKGNKSNEYTSKIMLANLPNNSNILTTNIRGRHIKFKYIDFDIPD